MSKIILEPYRSNSPQADQHAIGYSLLWRQRKLIVQTVPQKAATVLPPLSDPALLVECLQRSPIQLVKLDLGCDEANLIFWAEACLRAGKPVFLRVPSLADLPAKQHPFYWRFKRGMDWLVAATLLLLLSPILLFLALIIRLFSPGPILVREWSVGERGRLFRVFKFRTTTLNSVTDRRISPQSRDQMTAVGRWIYAFSLDQLPQLFNVLRGEMSLIGPHPWELNHALSIPTELQRRLNALPGLTGVDLIRFRSRRPDLRELNQKDLKYLHDWSLMKDFQYLLLTVPRVFGQMIAP